MPDSDAQPEETLTKYGDHACPVCGSHDTTVARSAPPDGELWLLCRPGGHRWTVRITEAR